MIIAVLIVSLIIGILLLFGAEAADYNKEDTYLALSIVSFVIFTIALIFGCFNGFIAHPATEGIHQGVITAVDLEGVYFRRYEVYLKSSGYTTQSDETAYKIYDYEKDLAEELKECIGKEVKLHYGHDGGYIGWNSCGTYHIKSVELVEEE